MTLLITSKHIARQSPKINELLDITLASFRQTVDFINSAERKDEFSAPDFEDARAVREKLLFLNGLAVEMQAMMARAAVMGYRIPERIIPGALRYLAMIKKLASCVE